MGRKTKALAIIVSLASVAFCGVATGCIITYFVKKDRHDYKIIGGDKDGNAYPNVPDGAANRFALYRDGEQVNNVTGSLVGDVGDNDISIDDNGYLHGTEKLDKDHRCKFKVIAKIDNESVATTEEIVFPTGYFVIE